MGGTREKEADSCPQSHLDLLTLGPCNWPGLGGPGEQGGQEDLGSVGRESAGQWGLSGEVPLGGKDWPGLEESPCHATLDKSIPSLGFPTYKMGVRFRCLWS